MIFFYTYFKSLLEELLKRFQVFSFIIKVYLFFFSYFIIYICFKII